MFANVIATTGRKNGRGEIQRRPTNLRLNPSSARSVTSDTARKVAFDRNPSYVRQEDVKRIHDLLQQELDTVYNTLGVSADQLRSGTIQGLTYINEDLRNKHDELRTQLQQLGGALTGTNQITAEQMKQADETFTSFASNVQTAVTQHSEALKKAYEQIEKANQDTNDLAQKVSYLSSKLEYQEQLRKQSQLEKMQLEHRLNETINKMKEKMDDHEKLWQDRRQREGTPAPHEPASPTTDDRAAYSDEDEPMDFKMPGIKEGKQSVPVTFKPTLGPGG